MNYRNLVFYTVIILGALTIAFLPFPIAQGTPGDKIIDIEASQFQFNPGIIRVQPGDKITLNLTAVDVAHGIYLDDYNLKLYADPGQNDSVTFTADQEGTFRFRCSASCGSMHPFMIGKIQVGRNLTFLRGTGISLLVILALLVRSRS
ncbi:MAG: cupredoxin domain-containing protein [Anaerolineales bacterium]